jgi:hypothetical protein
LTQHYKSGKIDNKLLKVAINRLTEKLWHINIMQVEN